MSAHNRYPLPADARTPQLGLTDEARHSVANLLAARLADVYVLLVKTRQCHWNVTGPVFAEMHEFFGEQYEQLNDMADELAERIRQLGFLAPGSMVEFIRLATLREHPADAMSPTAMTQALLADHEALIQLLRADIETCGQLGDAGNADELTVHMKALEKSAWMLRAHMS